MKCPVDGELLVITERSGVELDYCPRCRGVWLDRGELDKIIAVAASEPALRPEPARSAQTEHDSRREDARGYRETNRKKKRKSGFADILEDLFDFD